MIGLGLELFRVLLVQIDCEFDGLLAAVEISHRVALELKYLRWDEKLVLAGKLILLNVVARLLETHGELQALRGFTAAILLPELQESLLILVVDKTAPFRLALLGGLLLLHVIAFVAGLVPQGSEHPIQVTVVEGGGPGLRLGLGLLGHARQDREHPSPWQAPRRGREHKQRHRSRWHRYL